MNAGKLMMLFGIALTIFGAAVWFFGWFFGRIPGLDRLGRLPGDIRFERPGVTFYFPWVTCLVLSILLTLALRLFQGGGK